MSNAVFELFAKLTLDPGEFERELKGSESKFSAFGSKIKSIAGTAVKITTAAVTAGAGVVAKIAQSAIASYADYEQLIGGIETLFGKSAGTVIENAQTAYKTAGMSANEYMETVMNFSASLLQSLGNDTEAAASMADLAVQDMSDNANKMGTDIERIVDAYRGFARGNFTMLDNLSLGYGGTKQEMERLIEDAERLDSSFQATRDESGNLVLSFSDIVEAIHIVQTEMGITGTTAKEASTTISGSISSMKAAWRNLITGIADENANFSQLVDDFINTLVGEGGQGGVINNLVPRIQQTLTGIMRLITSASEQLLPLIVSTIITNLPALIQAGLQIVNTLSGAIMDNLPTLIDASIQIIQMITSTIITPDNLVALIDAGLQILLALADALIDALPQLIPAVVQIILTIVEKLTEPETVVKLLEAALQIAIALGEGLIKAIPEIIKAIPKIVEAIIKSFLELGGKIKETGKELLLKARDGLADALPNLTEKASEAAEKAKEAIKKRWESAKAIGSLLITTIQSGISDRAASLHETATKIGTDISEYFEKFSETAKSFGNHIMLSIRSGISEKINDISSALRELTSSLSDIFRNLGDSALQWGRDLIGNFVNGLTEKLQALKDKAIAIAQQIKDVIGFSEPKEGPLSKFHTFAPDMMELWAKGIRENEHLVTDAIANAADFGDKITAADFSAGQAVGFGGSRGIGSAPRMQTIILQVGRTELARLVHELNGEEDERIGLKLVTA